MAHEPEYYTTGEKIASAFLIGRAAVRAARGKDIGKVDAAITRLQAKAVAREEAEQAAFAEAEAARLKAEAEAKIAKRAARWI